MRRALATSTASVALAALVLSGCSEDPAPETSTPAAPVTPSWNPCSSLDTDAVVARLGSAYTVRRGTAEAPTCTFVPDTEGDPVVDINYNTFSGSLTELLKQFGDVDAADTTVTTPKVAGAADARLITTVDVDDDTLRITGFVRNGVLVQLVNVLDPAPFDQAAVVDEVESLMADLAAGAEASGLTGSSSTPTPTPSGTPSA